MSSELGNRSRPGTGSFFRQESRCSATASTANRSHMPENCACPASSGRERLPEIVLLAVRIEVMNKARDFWKLPVCRRNRTGR